MAYSKVDQVLLLVHITINILQTKDSQFAGCCLAGETTSISLLKVTHAFYSATNSNQTYNGKKTCFRARIEKVFLNQFLDLETTVY